MHCCIIKPLLKYPGGSITTWVLSFSQLLLAYLDIGKGYAGSLTCCYRQLPDGGIEVPIGLGGALIHFLHPVITGRQLHVDDTGIRGGEGRAGHRLGSGLIRIHMKLPSTKVLAVSGFLDDPSEAFRQIIVEGHCSSCPVGNGHLLRVSTGTHILGFHRRIRMPQLLDIHRPRSQSGNADAAVGIGGVGAVQQGRTGRIGVDTKFPAGQVLPGFRGLLQAQGTGCRRFQLKVGIETASLRAVQGDGGLIRGSTHVVDAVGGIFRRGNGLGRRMDGTVRDGSRLRDVQGVAGLGFSSSSPPSDDYERSDGYRCL